MTSSFLLRPFQSRAFGAYSAFPFLCFVGVRSGLTSRRSQPPLARSVPLSRFTSRVGGGSAFFVRRTRIVMLKWVAAIILLLFLGLCTVSYLYGVSLRQAGIIEGRMMLKVAAKDF